MPEVIGLNEEDAQIMLSNAGFVTRARIRFVESYERSGSVVQQHPMKGQLIDNDSPQLELNVSKRSYMAFLPQIYQVDAAMGNSFIREFL